MPRKRTPIPLITGNPKPNPKLDTYERLGVTPDSVAILPQITPILKQLPGGTDQAVEYLRGSAEPDARKWLGVYDEVPPSMRTKVPFEAYCLAANLTTKRVLELVTGACFEQSTNAAILIAKANHPKVVKATVKSALGKRGEGDRKMLHLHEGFVPIPKTNIVSVRGDVNTDNRVQTVNVGELGGIESKMARITNRFNERLGMGGGDVDRPALLADVDTGGDSVDSDAIGVAVREENEGEEPGELGPEGQVVDGEWEL